MEAEYREGLPPTSPVVADRPHGHGEAQRFPIAVGHA